RHRLHRAQGPGDRRPEPGLPRSPGSVSRRKRHARQSGSGRGAAPGLSGAGGGRRLAARAQPAGPGREPGDGLGLAGSGGGLGRFRRLARAAKGRADGEAGRSGRAGRAVVPDRRRHPAAGDAPAGRTDVEPRRLARRLLHPAAPPAVDGGGSDAGHHRPGLGPADRRAPGAAARDRRGVRRPDRRRPAGRRVQSGDAGAGRGRYHPVAVVRARRVFGLGRLVGPDRPDLRLWLRLAGRSA
uniref:Transcriptional regulator, AraC family n=1 Tax=Parastrongyloides trichosuri TaxID=131310 RepID=A0A0N5A048_PARTI